MRNIFMDFFSDDEETPMWTHFTVVEKKKTFLQFSRLENKVNLFTKKEIVLSL